MEEKRDLNEYRMVFELDKEAMERYLAVNHENYEKMKQALYEVGVWLDYNPEENRTVLRIIPELYDKAKKRNAGRSRKIAITSSDDTGKMQYCRYSDIVCMMQTMADKEIAEKIGMSLSTFYRHKKRLKSSSYFASLDKNRLEDLEYLNSVSQNFVF